MIIPTDTEKKKNLVKSHNLYDKKSNDIQHTKNRSELPQTWQREYIKKKLIDNITLYDYNQVLK